MREFLLGDETVPFIEESDSESAICKCNIENWLKENKIQ